MNIPVDEMLSELKTVLEQLDRDPTFANFDRVQKETARLERTCEDAVFAALDVPNAGVTGADLAKRPR